MSEAEFEFESRIARALEQYAPPVDRRGDWDALLRDAGPAQPMARRAFAVAAVVGTVLLLGFATPLGGAIRNVVADFSNWVAGTPGTPVSDEEQREFDEQNARSWVGFPGSPKLRRLIRNDVGGTTYDLVGFRSGGSLCIRIRTTGEAEGSEVACAPIEELRNDDAPARVLLADWGVGRGDKQETIGFDTITAPRAQVTAGIAADGVEAVELLDDQGTHRVAVTSNAFLYVADRPDVGQRVSRVRADLTDGGSVAIPFTMSSFGDAPGFGGSSGEPGGPTKVERVVHGGTIGWLERRESRGEPIDDAIQRLVGFARIDFGRILNPDPGNARRVVFAIGELRGGMPSQQGRTNFCYTLVGRGTAAGGCGPVDGLLSRAPFTSGYSTSGVGDQYATFAGLASDDVERLELFTATGNRIHVPLRDNAFLVDVALARLPAKMVAYDAQGRVIGIERSPRQEAPQHVTSELTVDLSATVAGVGTLELRANKTREGGECWAARGRGTADTNTGSCIPKEWTFAPLRIGTHPDPAVFVFGRVRGDIKRLTLRYADGEATDVTPRQDGYLLTVVPEEHRGPGHQLVEIVGRGADGHVVDRLRFSVR
jgi:hypothetical protein